MQLMRPYTPIMFTLMPCNGSCLDKEIYSLILLRELDMKIFACKELRPTSDNGFGGNENYYRTVKCIVIRSIVGSVSTKNPIFE